MYLYKYISSILCVHVVCVHPKILHRCVLFTGNQPERLCAPMAEHIRKGGGEVIRVWVFIYSPKYEYTKSILVLHYIFMCENLHMYLCIYLYICKVGLGVRAYRL